MFEDNINKKNSKFIFKKEDFFIVSYPRSGNSWMRYLLANMIFPELKWNITNLNGAIPDLHQEIPKNYLEGNYRIFKSHFKKSSNYFNVIYLCRDGRDVIVSYYDLLKKVRKISDSFNDFFNKFMNGALPFGSWADHISYWNNKPDNYNLLFLKYEDMCSSIYKELSKIVDFMGLDLSEKSILDAIEKSTFLKQQYDFYRYKKKTHWNNGFTGGVKGGPGKWKGVLNTEQKNRFWDKYGSLYNLVGYDRD